LNFDKFILICDKCISKEIASPRRSLIFEGFEGLGGLGA
jgi:hypothetical protein